MKKLLILVVIACLMGSLCVSAQNISRNEQIVLGQTKTVTVPQPTGEVDPSTVYFQQEFLFTPEESGTYRMTMIYDDDPDTPYNVFLDVPGAYTELENGIEFEATAGEEYAICFQYPNHDGRYPEITFFLGTPDMEPIPPTNDRLFFLPMFCLLISAGLLVISKKYPQAA